MGTVILSEVSELTTVKISELEKITSMSNAGVLPVVESTETKGISKSDFIKDIPISVENVYYVAKNGSDSNTGTIGDPFLTIGYANDYAIARIPDYPRTTIINVAPGLYKDEHIANSHYGIHFMGNSGYTGEKERVAIIANTGVDADHHPLGMNGNLRMTNMGIATMNADYTAYVPGVFGTLLDNSQFTNCMFEGGYFVEQEEADTVGVTLNFDKCSFDGDAFKLANVVRNKHRFIALRNCDLFGGALSFETTGTYIKTLKLERTKISNRVDIKGDWNLLCNSSELYEDTGAFVFDTNGYIDIYNSTIVNGLHFTSDASGYKKIINNYFKNITPGQCDITADTAIANVDFLGNKTENGLSYLIQTQMTEKNVGEGSPDRYCSIQAAISSIPTGGTGIIKVFGDQSDLAELTLPNENVHVSVDCQRKYDLTFSGDIVTIGDNRKFDFHRTPHITGGNIEVNGTNAIVEFQACYNINSYITLTSGVGSKLSIWDSTQNAPSGHRAITINNTNTAILIGQSVIIGATGHPAVVFTVNADSCFRGKFSTFIHGDGGANSPLLNTDSGKINIATYNCGMNAYASASQFTNLIGSANNTADPAIDF